MADSLVNSALQKLESMTFDALKLQTEVGKKVQGLRDDLAWLRLLLRDADQRRRQEINEYIELWVRQTREVAFDAEDLLDEYFHEGRLHCSGVLDLPSFLRWLRRSATRVFVRQSICADIEAIKGRLEQIKKKADDNNVKLLSLPTTAWADRRKHGSALGECKIEDPNNLVGIDDELKQIKEWLINPEKTRHRTVVAIMGKSGAGKTTLASCTYESSEVRATFQCIIWVHVPKKFRLVDVLGDMDRQTTIAGMVSEPERKQVTTASEPKRKQATMVSETEKMQDKLNRSLAGKKYLIVLDDVHSLEELKLFLSVLPECEGNRGSAVVITMEVKAHHISDSFIEDGEDTYGRLHPCDHHVVLNKLEKKNAGEMFCRRVFGKPSFPKNFSNNATHSKAIEDLLDSSLPLAGTLLAGILRTKKEEEWVDVINQLTQHKRRLEQQAEQEEKMQEKQQQPGEGQEANQQPVGQQEEMKMKKEQHGEVEKMTRQPGEKEKMAGQQEEIQQDKQSEEEKKESEQQQEQPVYRQISLLDQILMLSFDDLPPYLKQCFLYFSAFKAEDHINADKLIRLWVAEGLVRPTDGRTMEKNGQDYLKMLISRCLVNLVKMDYSNNIISISIHERTLAFARSEAHDINFLQVHHSTTDLPSTAIRRLAIRNAFDPYTRLTLATPKLRSLQCECPEAPGADTSYISKVSQFVTGRVNCLSIHHCKFLRVVDLQGMVHRSTLPHEIGWLIYLQYLGLAHTGLKRLPWTIKNLRSLQTLDITDTEIKQVPKGFWKIKALRHVLARHIKNGPSQDNALNNLQTLHGVRWKGSALKKLINLRSLGLRRINNYEGLVDSLRSMECLTSLDLDAKSGIDLPLHQLITMLVLRNLQSLKLNGRVSKLAGTTEEQISNGPSHSYLLHNLTKLELYNSELDQAHINLISKVPNLADLILGTGSYVGQEMVIPADGFPELKRLHLNTLPKLQKWSVAEGSGLALKQLQQTFILNCNDLKEVLQHLKTLNHLVLLAVHNCPKIGELPPRSDFQSKELLIVLEEMSGKEKADNSIKNKTATNDA